MAVGLAAVLRLNRGGNSAKPIHDVAEDFRGSDCVEGIGIAALGSTEASELIISNREARIRLL